MNDDDLLARASRAMRESTTPELLGGPIEEANDRLGSHDDARSVAATTLARIERSTRRAHVSGLRKRTITRWLVTPMAASFVVFAAWASASGRIGQWVGSAHPREPLEARDEKPVTGPRPSASAIPAVIVEPPVSVVEPPAPRPPPIAKPAVKAVDIDALYNEAHEAHFVRHDHVAALAAWDRYLTAAGPSGRFALEARYNRAITLVRLGRKADASAALRPFADGEYGGYRRDEAAQLLRSID